jgi:serine protease Do
MLSSLIVAVMALAQAGGAGSSAFDAAALQSIYNRVSPAVCVLSYSYELTNPSTGERTRQDAYSPGLLVTPQGLVMARGHIALENIEPYNIRVAIGRGAETRQYDAVLLPKPGTVNVVFMQVQSDEPLDLPYLRFAESSRLELGQPVAIVGILSPALDYNPAVVVRRIGSILEEPRRTYCLDDGVTSSYIGGAVVDATGAAVGVVGFDLAPGEGGDVYVRSGHPLVYQADLFARYIENPLTEESADESDDAWLGVFTQPLTDDLAEYWGLPKNGGAVVSTIVPGSPADQSGLARGDVIVALNGAPVRAKQDREVFVFTRMVREAGVGAEVQLDVLREGKPIALTVALAPQPRAARDAREFEDTIFGLTVRELTTDVRIMLNLPADVQGVIVRRVESGSWAALGNIRPGVILMSFGGHPVASVEDFQNAVSKVAQDKPKEVTVFGRVGPVTGFFRLEPVWGDDGE